ncbi:uncharacterized protein KIAA1522 homolog isoform X2 [Etheostoma cragini]|uniref:uncharacterized protein KIAA1522 homolog isoform X2 n=1 Tax=Etheostoma cragini TaxID=417921 RepID=UPI00155DE000|nr:uncharacterized protein KIAA1522 homolog isoform X2 [Etheostoma cragini]
MSNRDSMGFGDLIPQDVVDIFAQDKHSKRGRKKRSNSLGRALGWLKGKKRKDLDAKGQSLGLGPALDLALDGHPAGHHGGHKGGQKSGRPAHPQAVPKRVDEDKTPAPPLIQENVFIEGSRHQYLENLHTEALEGLKMMQEEENNHGMEFRDNESTVSTMTVHTDGEGGGFMTDSTIADTTSVVSVRSSVSTRSSRSGLTRQESTFRPLNSGKKTKTRRRHTKTVVGIPQHVQRELGLDRVGWSLTRRLDEEQLYNGETDDSTTTDGTQQAAQSQKGASASLQHMNVIHPLNKGQLEQLGATHAGHRDDLALLHHLGPAMSGGQRPQSLAVPCMTTANSLQQEPPGLVMSMSPQAPYMSKIIPNAVLPPSIDVVEISRGRSRNSVRTVSKSSLVLSSPVPSRASSRASSSRTISSRASNITSASRYNPSNMSDSSCWSNSESSETLVSDSSTISSSSTPRQMRSQDGDASAKEDKISVYSSISKASKCTSNGQLIIKGDGIKKEGSFARSLSVMKPKRAPPPPSRSYSLHSKMKRRSRDLAEDRINSRESPLQNAYPSGEEIDKNKSFPVPSITIDNPGYNADTSSLDDSSCSVSFSPIRLPLQAITAEADGAKVDVMVSKEALQGMRKPLQENDPSKIISPSSGYSSQDGRSPQLSKQPQYTAPRHKIILAKLQRLFPGSTPAALTSSPLPPPDDLKRDTPVDAFSVSPSVRALRELFNIPPPPKVHAPPPPPPEVWAHSKRSVELLLGPPVPDNLYAIIKKNPKDRRQQRQSPSASTEGSVKSLVVERKHKNPALTVESGNGESEILSAEIQKENNDRLAELNVDMKGNSKVTEEVEKVRVSDLINGMLVKAVEKREGRLAAVREEEEEAKKTSTQTTEVKTDNDILPAISLVRIPPSPSLPVHPPLQPPTKHSTKISSVTSVVVSPELSWPPPPPLIAQAGPDQVDFPLPPPPMFAEVGIVLPVQVPPERSIPGNVTSVVKTECVRVAAETEPEKPSTSQGIVPPPLSIPPPPSYMAPPPPVKAVSPPMPKKVFPPPPPTEVLPSPPKEVSPLPPKEVSPVRPKESSPPMVQESPPTNGNYDSGTLVTVVHTAPVEEVSPLPHKEICTLSTEDISSQESACQSSEEATPVIKLTPPHSIPPPPPLPSQPKSSEQEIDLPQESSLSTSGSNVVSFNSILTPPQSIPPPAPIQFLHQPQVVLPNTVGPATQEPSLSPPSEVSVPLAFEKSPSPEKAQELTYQPVNIPLPPPLPGQGLVNIKDKPSPASTENQTAELTSALVVQKGPTPIVTPSLLQKVKLRSVNSSPETPKAPEPPESEVTMRKQEPSNLGQTSSASGEAPQKPIRRSLIIVSTTPINPPPNSPPPTSPPAIVIAHPALPKSQSVLVLPASSSRVASPTKKAPPAMTSSPSMNLQEAIRLRTAARSNTGPGSRLSLNSPTSPIDLRKSPSTTASFIFSKSNKKVVIETKLPPETMATVQKNVVSQAESVKQGLKVPPPVARKPKAKGKENECEETEQTAGQEAMQASIEDAAEITNGTAGTVEGGMT